MPKTRAIRFSNEEDKLITEFLNRNSFFDFSSLARTAIIKFIEEPKLEMTPVKRKKQMHLSNVGEKNA